MIVESPTIQVEKKEEKKEACSDFQPQAFKPTHCATCFLPKAEHKNVSSGDKMIFGYLPVSRTYQRSPPT
jgi:hypothetical protein